jgi:hypothetical protein
MLLDSSGPSGSTSTAPLDHSHTTGLPEDMGAPSQAKSGAAAGIDFFSDLGTERTRKPRPEVPNPEKVRTFL